MKPHGEGAILITAPWNDWRSARVTAKDLLDLHWHQPSGAPKPLLHAYVSCADLFAGELSHVCDASTAPHRIRVCILKRHNTADAYSELASRASSDLPAPNPRPSGQMGRSLAGLHRTS